MPRVKYRIGDPRNDPSYGCEEMGLSEFIRADCATNGALYLDAFEIGTVLLLLVTAVGVLFAPSIYWLSWRRKVSGAEPAASVSDLLSEFQTPEETDEVWTRCLVAERGDQERAKYAYVEQIADEAKKRTSISIGKRAGFILLQFILTSISFGLVRDLLGTGHYFVSGIGAVAILYIATSK